MTPEEEIEDEDEMERGEVDDWDIEDDKALDAEEE